MLERLAGDTLEHGTHTLHGLPRNSVRKHYCEQAVGVIVLSTAPKSMARLGVPRRMRKHAARMLRLLVDRVPENQRRVFDNLAAPGGGTKYSWFVITAAGKSALQDAARCTTVAQLNSEVRCGTESSRAEAARRELRAQGLDECPTCYMPILDPDDANYAARTVLIDLVGKCACGKHLAEQTARMVAVRPAAARVQATGPLPVLSLGRFSTRPPAQTLPTASRNVLPRQTCCSALKDRADAIAAEIVEAETARDLLLAEAEESRDDPAERAALLAEAEEQTTSLPPMRRRLEHVNRQRTLEALSGRDPLTQQLAAPTTTAGAAPAVLRGGGSEALDAFAGTGGGAPSNGAYLRFDSSDDESDDGPSTLPAQPVAQQPPRLTAANALGRRVLVPRHLWPDYACREHGGQGWEAEVARVDRGWALVNFLFAKDLHGRRYPPAWLQLWRVSALHGPTSVFGGATSLHNVYGMRVLQNPEWVKHKS